MMSEEAIRKTRKEMEARAAHYAEANDAVMWNWECGRIAALDLVLEEYVMGPYSWIRIPFPEN